MTEKTKNNPPEIEETPSKTYESEPLSMEEFQTLKHNLYDDDISGGLQNIEVPEEELDRQRMEFEHAQSFIDMKDDGKIPCYRTDLVHVKLTPEHLFVLTKALENLSLDMSEIEYLEQEKGMEYLYQQQTYIRHLRDVCDSTLTEYVRYRPYSPFLPVWFKKIGKHEITKD